jgi:hypothetical protein
MSAARPHAFGPQSFRIARFLLTARAETLIDLLDETSAAWPALSFEDFRGGYILSDILIRCPDQIRVVGDPVRWLDRVITLTSPPAGNA